MRRPKYPAEEKPGNVPSVPVFPSPYFPDSNSVDVRQQSLIALRRSGAAATEAVPRVRQVASDPGENAQVKRLAKEVLNKLGNPAN